MVSSSIVSSVEGASSPVLSNARSTQTIHAPNNGIVNLLGLRFPRKVLSSFIMISMAIINSQARSLLVDQNKSIEDVRNLRKLRLRKHYPSSGFDTQQQQFRPSYKHESCSHIVLRRLCASWLSTQPQWPVTLWVLASRESHELVSRASPNWTCTRLQSRILHGASSARDEWSWDLAKPVPAVRSSGRRRYLDWG